MNGPIPQPAIDRSAEAVRWVNPPGHDFQELWFALARRRWTSLVLVPADEGGSAVDIATSLAEVGKRLRHNSVAFFVMADPLDYESAAQIVGSIAATGQGGNAPANAPSEKVVVAIKPVVVEPLGLAVTQAADAVILCIEVGRTRLAAARRTIELIGRERITGSLLIR